MLPNHFVTPRIKNIDYSKVGEKYHNEEKIELSP
jgi:hypothetical protein